MNNILLQLSSHLGYATVCIWKSQKNYCIVFLGNLLNWCNL